MQIGDNFLARFLCSDTMKEQSINKVFNQTIYEKDD
jgi:hypothetical protein